MNAPLSQQYLKQTHVARNEVASRLRKIVAGEVLFDAASRGRYATDASIYQIDPVGVLVPRSFDDVAAAIDLCREMRVPLVGRGGGTSQCGQTVGAALVIDNSKALCWTTSMPGSSRMGCGFPLTSAPRHSAP
jgi:hypothetical protein